MDPHVLGLSATFAAAKLALALWIAQLALPLLDRRRVPLAWQITLSAAGMVASWWAVRDSGAPAWWGASWMVSSFLAAAALIDSVRRWVSDAKLQSARGLSERIHGGIAIVGLSVAAVACAARLAGQLPFETLTLTTAVVQLLASAGLLGIVLAACLELTFGATGATLLGRNWRPLARWSSLGLLLQLAASASVIISGREGATLVESLTPIFFALGMLVVGYIVWAIPRQMVALAAKGRMEGQASLALAGWLAAICLAVACGLPPAWPWRDKSVPSRQSSHDSDGTQQPGMPVPGGIR
jgi:hypothetical protein